MPESRPQTVMLPADGRDFEALMARLFTALGYQVALTPASHDFGADLLITHPRTHERIAAQTKFYAGHAVGVDAVQQAYAAMAHYGTREAWVVTQSSFTAGARELAANCGVRLVDGNTLKNLMAQAGMELVTAAPSPAPSADDKAATPAPRDVPEDMLSLTDVCARWGCSPARVKAEISAGMPMVKTPSGRWAISPEDVAAWERHRAREAATLRRARKIRAAIPVAVILVAFALLVAFIGRLIGA